MNRPKLFIITTSPVMFYYILRGQPKFLNNYFDVHLVTAPGPLVADIKAIEGVEVHTIGFERNISLLSDFCALFRLSRLLLREYPDIVHSYSPKAGLLGMLASKIARVNKRIHTFTGLIFPSRTGLFRILLMLMDRITCLCATAVIPESLGVSQDLVNNRICKKPHNLIGFGNIAGVDTDFYRPFSEIEKNNSRRSYNISQSSWVFCFVGRIHQEKGVSELIRAFSRLEGDYYLIIVGSKDETSPVSEEISMAMASNPRIICTGWIDDVRLPLGCADVNILPSYREGFPNVLLQASAMGIPSIATDVNGARDIIQDGKTGWLIPIKNEVKLFTAMKQASRSRSECKRRGHEGVSMIQKRFDQVIYRNKLVNFYKQLLNH
jgi:glycosyltransferase involved in cell wall biosynthesis